MIKLKHSVSLQQIVQKFGGELRGDVERKIFAVKSLTQAGSNEITFIAKEKYLPQLSNLKNTNVIIKPQWLDMLSVCCNAIITDDPYLYYAKLSNWLQELYRTDASAHLVHPSAQIDSDVTLGKNVRIGAFSYIASGAVIADEVSIGAHCTVEQNVNIGFNTKLLGRVYIGNDCKIGAHCVLKPGAVIGGDGFGFVLDNGKWVRIAQLGRVVLGDNVEIGSNSCVDRGTIDDTVIEDGVKIDNLIQIGHNVYIGANTAMAAGVGIAGSTKIGKNCTVGGASGIAGHLTITDNTHIAAATNVSRSIYKSGEYCGLYPFEEKRSWSKNASIIRQLSSLRQRVIQLEKDNN